MTLRILYGRPDTATSALGTPADAFPIRDGAGLWVSLHVDPGTGPGSFIGGATYTPVGGSAEEVAPIVACARESLALWEWVADRTTEARGHLERAARLVESWERVGARGAAVLTLPALGVGESAQVTVPDGCHVRVMALARFLPYGPGHSRVVWEGVARMSRAAGHGDQDAAVHWLEAAERVAATGGAR